MPADPSPVGPRETTPVATRAGVTRDTAALLRTGHRAAPSATALRTRSVHAREVLVELAWPGGSPAQVDAWAASGAPLPGYADPLHLGHYARVLCLQGLLPDDVDRGRAILEALAAQGRLDEVHHHAVQVLLQLRARDQDHEAAEQILGHRGIPQDVRAAVRADLANPFLRPAAGPDSLSTQPGPTAVEPWLDQVSRALLAAPLAPLRLDPRLGSTPFDQLTTDPLRPAGTAPDAPLVTVVVSAYRPGPPLLTALRSLLAQTWQRLEIVVVDDASPDRAAVEPLLQTAEALDARIRVVRQRTNGGTYRARNTVIRQARGQLLTCLDSDDWLHPQAIETLVTALREDSSRMAAVSLAARVPEHLGLSRVGYPLRVVGAPTLMVRFDPVITRLGFFDPARKAADTEYARRIVAAFGNRAVHQVHDCLLLLRSGDTLSSSEFAPRWRHPARHAYKNVYTPWHEEIRAGAPAYLDPGERRLVHPLRWRRPGDDPGGDPAGDGTGRSDHPPRYDLVVGGDWRRHGGPQRSMLQEIRVALAAGWRVGVLHLEALRFATHEDLPLCRPLIDLVRRREVDLVQLDDDVEVDVLQIRYPLVLQHPPHLPTGAFTPRHLLLVANQAPVEPDGTDQRYVVSDVSARARELFGADPVWVPQSPVIREVLRTQDPHLLLAEHDNPGLIDPDEWWVPDRPLPGAGGAPVRVGRYSRDAPGKHPPTHAELLAAYDLGPGYAVRLMGSTRTWARLLGEAGLPAGTPPPSQWEMLSAGALQPRDLLADLDVFLYQDHPGRVEAFGRVLLEAAASGVLVIAHPRHRAVFGDLVDYAEPADAKALIEGYVAAPDRLLRRRARTRELVLERYTGATYLDALGAVRARPERCAHERA